jgi:hypothetical protein
MDAYIQNFSKEKKVEVLTKSLISMKKWAE